MLVTPSNLNLFFTTLETRFWTAFTIEKPWFARLATTYTVDSEDWASGWMDPTQPMREWQGARVISPVGLEVYKVKMQIFEKTQSVDEFKLKWDKHGMYMPIAADFGRQAAKWPDQQLRDLMQNKRSQVGARQNGVDGLTHWHTAHPIDPYDSSKGTFCNDFRSGGVVINGVTVGGAFGVNPFNTLYQEFASRKSPNGEALGIEPDLSMFPTQLKATATTVLQSQFFAPATIGNLTGQVGSVDNPLKGWTDLFVNKDLQGDATSWQMMYAGGAIKPYSWLLNQAPDFITRQRPDDPKVFDTHTYLYGSKSVGAPAWGFPWLSAISGP